MWAAAHICTGVAPASCRTMSRAAATRSTGDPGLPKCAGELPIRTRGNIIMEGGTARWPLSTGHRTIHSYAAASQSLAPPSRASP